MPMFDDLREAIDKVIEEASTNRVGAFLGVVQIESIENLRRVANTYFVEPEDDQEFKEWQQH